jgi:four helix bundle protein
MSKEQNLFRFLSWKVYRDAQRIFLEILKIVRRLPADIRYSLGSQLIRSALSIILNIAEGSGRGTDKELNRFFNIAIGSINEIIAALDTLREAGHISSGAFGALFSGLGGRI